MEFHSESHPHRRYNPLTGQWLLVSPHRTQRPWLGQKESATNEKRPAHDPQCYLCPGNKRAGDSVNPAYEGTFVFRNDYSSMLPDTPVGGQRGDPLFQTESVRGECRVICFSPRHDLSLAEMPVAGIRDVIDVWAQETADLGARYPWVQVFENKGAVMGCSNPHPHGQLWACSAVPNEPAAEDLQQSAYYRKHGSILLLDYAEREVQRQERVVVMNDHWVALVPFWAVWPFETLLLPRQTVLRLPDLNPAQRESLSSILKRLLCRYDNLFEVSFPYSMGWHGAPYGSEDRRHWQLHAHFYPPLLRSATVKKFMVGYEMLSEAQRDLTPELAAKRLRELPDERFG